MNLQVHAHATISNIVVLTFSGQRLTKCHEHWSARAQMAELEKTNARASWAQAPAALKAIATSKLIRYTPNILPEGAT